MKGSIYTLLFFIAIGFSMFMACGPSDKRNSDKDNKPTFTVDTFSTFPPEIVSCSAYYAADSKLFAKQAYIVMGNCAELAFLKINGVLTQFKQTDIQKISDKHIIQTYKSDHFELVLDIKDGELIGSEVWRQTGKLTLKDEDGGRFTGKLYGECGF